jgi:formylglycine-generating enzyme required for sulfatase activity
VFTQELLRQLGQPGLEIGETFKLTGKAVAAATNGAQVPAIYSQFFESYYLLPAPVAGDSGDGKDSGAQQGSGSVASAQPKPSSGTKMTVSLPYGSIVATTRSKGTLYLDGVAMGELPAGAEARLDEILVGEHELWMRYGSGQDETRRVSVEKDGVLRVAFSGSVLASLAIASVPAGMIPMVFVEGGSFMMGSDTGESDEKPEHRVTLSPFYFGKYEVTQAQYRTVTGTNPSYFADGGDADRRPVEQVSWHDAVAFCNRLSDREGLSKVYAMSGIAVTADFSRNGYHLPTEAEWEYAARGGKVSRGFTYSGSKDLGQVAWFRSNSGSATHTIGAKTANELGLHDMSGNVWEWCNDWYDSGYYGKSPQDYPAGASSEEGRVYRGGGWSYYDEFCRSVNRSGRNPGSLDNFVGFRVARRP